MDTVRGSSGRLFRLVEHEIHHDDDGGPEHHLLVPEQHLAIVEKCQADQDGSGHQGVTNRRIFDHGIGPDGDAAEVDQQRHHVDFEPSADGEEHVEKADEHQGCADHHPGDMRLAVRAAVFFGALLVRGGSGRTGRGIWKVAGWCHV
jgi:hypothetical protein